MAVYGRHKEKWDPSKIKSKTTKNRTYELKKTNSLSGTFEASDKLYELINPTSILDGGGGSYYVGGGLIVKSNNKGLESWNNLLEGKDYASIGEIEATRYKEKAIRFSKVANGASFHRSFIRPASSNTRYTGALFSGSRTYTTYISFWLQLDSSDFHGSDGHSFGGLYRSGESNDSTTIQNQDPILLFSTSSSGQLIIRYLDAIAGSDVESDGTYSPDHVTWSVPTTDKMIAPNEWVYCTVGFTPISTFNNSNLENSVKLWINGNSVSLAPQSYGSVSAETSGLEWRLGNTGNTFDDRIAQEMHLSDGFAGSLGQISIITQSHSAEKQWNDFAKFLHEAYQDGVYSLHSGVHDAEPKRQLINRDRDLLYPPSYSMDSYTKFEDDEYFAKKNEPAWKESSRRSLASETQFIEGFNTSDSGYEWKENPSQYFVNSTDSVPYLQLDPTDTLLSNGNWYSDARSEFFSEDLSTSAGGFGIRASSNHTPSNSTALYKKNATENNYPLFVEENVPNEYKDCIVIEIPIPSQASLTLSTDGDGDTERRQFGVSAFQSSRQSINTMAYYNFETNRWEHTVPSYSTDGSGADATPVNYNWVNKGDIGFGPMTGLVLPYKQEDVEYLVDLYGRPISDFGFPFADKFSSSSGQGIDLSQYIDEPVVLAGWEMFQKVIPTVGYQHDGNTEDGPDTYYATTNIISSAPATGSRSKVVFSPSSSVAALGVTTVPGITLASYSYNTTLIDVFYNGELQKAGTLTETTNGVADYFIDTDLNSNARIKFRYALTTNAVITVIARILGGGTRSKKYFSPTGSITAGTVVPVPNTLFGSSANLELIDVFYNGELQRLGTSSQVSAGTADVYIGTDSPPNGNLIFRYNITSTDEILVISNTTNPVADSSGEVTGTRRKVTINPSSNVAAGNYLSVTGLALGDYSYDGDKIDVYANGELQRKGTESQLSAGTADYFIGTDSSSAGQIKFRYDISASDSVIVIARQMGITAPNDVGGTGTGRNPFYYGAHGHSTIMWDNDNLASPFTEEYHTDSDSGNWYHHNTVPIDDGVRGLKTKSIITKGVTAFLLKESNFVDAALRKDNFHSKTRKVSLATNTSRNSGTTWGAPAGSNDVIGDIYEPTTTSLISMDYENTSFFSNQTTRSLVGYLQHVYHNDPSPLTSRSADLWIRNGFDNEKVGQVPSYISQLNLIGILDRENETYIENILRTNTSAVDFHVSGSVKIQPQIDSSFPITNFKIQDIFNVSSISAPQSNNSYHVQGLFGSSEGNVDNALTNVEFIPSMSGIAAKKPVMLPTIAVPSNTNGANNAQLTSWKNTLETIQGSKNQLEDAETILRPSDRLILGIQDSVSTSFASQQNKINLSSNSHSDSGFIRWGRNSLTVPVQKDAYIRLYIKKTRKNKTFNVLSTTKGYSANVYRGLGDHFISDQHLQNTKLSYSGSISDDIIGPTYFTPPEIEQSIPSTGNPLDGVDPYGGMQIPISYSYGYTNLVWWTQSSNRISWKNNIPGESGHAGWSRSDAVIPWYALSQITLSNSNDKPTLQLSSNLSSDPRTQFADAFVFGLLGTLVHPQNLFLTTNGPWTGSYRWAMGTLSVPEELNTNTTASYSWSSFPWKDKNNANQTHNFNNLQRTGSNCNAASAWYQTIAFPLFEKLDHRYDPQFTFIPVTFRLVQIGTYITSGSNDWVNGNNTLNGNYSDVWSGKYPVYSDGTEIAFGDVFYFDDNNESVKLLSSSQLKSMTAIPANQKILRTWRNHKPAGQELYIVGRKGKLWPHENLTSGPSFVDSTDSGTQFLTYNQVYDKIAEVLNAQKIVESSILYDRVESNVAGNFLNIKYPDDPIVRSILEGGKTEIDGANVFRLLNSNAAGQGGSLTTKLYIKKNPGDNSTFWTTGYGGNETYDAFYHPNKAGNGSALYPGQGNDITDSSTWETSALIPVGSNTWLEGYLRHWGWAGPDSLPFADRYFDLEADNYYPDDENGDPSRGTGSLQIDYSGVPSADITINITKETYSNSSINPNVDVSGIIDRKVSFRTTEKSAGAFGSLNPFFSTEAERTIHDSMNPDVTEVGLTSLDLNSQGVSQDWLMKRTKEKTPIFKLNSIKTKIGTGSTASGFDTFFTQDSQPIVTSSMALDVPGQSPQEWEFGTSSDSSTNWPTPIQNRYLNVTNYVQKQLGANRDYSEKTGRDFVFGFGNGPAGRHVVRPSLFKYKAFRSANNLNVITDSESLMVIEAVLDPPRGVKYGMYNTSQMKPTYKFSSRSYGQFRDLLEQALDTKFNSSDPSDVLDSPLVITCVNPMNPELPKDISESKRYNKTSNAIVDVPYIEDDYESTPQPINLDSESVRVDMPGRIKQGQILGPGSLSANIFRRGQ